MGKNGGRQKSSDEWVGSISPRLGERSITCEPIRGRKHDVLLLVLLLRTSRFPRVCECALLQWRVNVRVCCLQMCECICLEKLRCGLPTSYHIDVHRFSLRRVNVFSVFSVCLSVCLPVCGCITFVIHSMFKSMDVWMKLGCYCTCNIGNEL